MLDKVVIANRGEIALRILRACRELGIKTVAVHSTADRNLKHVLLADESVCIGPPPSRDSYLNMPAIISAAELTDSVAIHPGYGFLSENADFAERVEKSGFTFVGPRAETIRSMGDKASARRLAAGQPGGVHRVDQRVEEHRGLILQADRVPLRLEATRLLQVPQGRGEEFRGDVRPRGAAQLFPRNPLLQGVFFVIGRHGAQDPLLDVLVGGTGHGPPILPIHQDRLAVGISKAGDGLIQRSVQFCLARGWTIALVGESASRQSARRIQSPLVPRAVPAQVRKYIPARLEKPSGKMRLWVDGCGFFRQKEEHRLRGILGQVRIARQERRAVGDEQVTAPPDRLVDGVEGEADCQSHLADRLPAHDGEAIGRGPVVGYVQELVQGGPHRSEGHRA